MTSYKLLAFAGFLALAVVLAAHGLHATPFLMAASETGDVTAPAPQWKLSIYVTSPNGVLDNILTLIDTPGHARLFDTEADCVAFQSTDEFKDTLPALAEYIKDHGWEKDIIGIKCVLVPKTESF